MVDPSRSNLSQTSAVLDGSCHSMEPANNNGVSIRSVYQQVVPYHPQTCKRRIHWYPTIVRPVTIPTVPTRFAVVAECSSRRLCHPGPPPPRKRPRSMTPRRSIPQRRSGECPIVGKWNQTQCHCAPRSTRYPPTGIGQNNSPHSAPSPPVTCLWCPSATLSGAVATARGRFLNSTICPYRD